MFTQNDSRDNPCTTNRNRHRDATHCVSTRITGILLAFLMWANVTLNAQNYGEIVLFGSQTVMYSAEAYSAKWTDQTTGVLPASVYCEHILGEQIFVKSPQGKNVEARKYKAITNNCNGEAEMNAFSMAFEKTANAYKNSVLLYAVFDTKAQRDAFINNRAGALPWTTLATGNVPDWFSYSPHHQIYSYNGRYPDRPALTMGWYYQDPRFIVMEEQPYKKNAVAIKTKMVYPFTLDWSQKNVNGEWVPDRAYHTTPVSFGSGDGYTANHIEVTYTNTAPYPVMIAAYDPQIDPSLCKDEMDTRYEKTGGFNDDNTNEYAPSLNFKHWGLFDGDPSDMSNFTYAMPESGTDRYYMPMTLMPHESRTLTWVVHIRNGYFNDRPPYMQSYNRPFGYNVEVNNYTASSYVLVEGDGAEIIRTQVNETLPGWADDKMTVLSAQPLEFNTDSVNKILTLGLHHADRLGKIVFDNGGAQTEVAAANITPGGEPGFVKVNLQPYIGSTEGSFLLYIYDKDGDCRVSKTVYANPHVGVAPRSNQEKLFVITQNPQTQKFRYTGWFNTDETYGGETVLLDISTSIAERDSDTDVWTLKPQVTVNTLLASDNTGSFTLKVTPDEVLFEPKDGAALYHTGDYMQYENNNASGLGTRLTPADGNWKIRLTSDNLYNNAAPVITDGENDEYPDEWIAPFIETSSAFEVNLFGERPLAAMKNPVLYRDQISLAGSLNIASLLPYDEVKRFLNADLEVHDLRLGHKRKLLGARGDFSGFVGLNDPFGVLTSGGNMDIHWNNLPENLNKVAVAEGEMSVSMVGGVEGKISFAPVTSPEYTPAGTVKTENWFVDDIYAAISAPIPSPCPVIQISTLGIGVNGIASTLRLISDEEKGKNDKGLIPPLYFKGTLGLGLLDDDMLGVTGTANIGTTLGLTNGELQVLTLTILTDVRLTSTIQNSTFGNKGVFYTKNGAPIPLAKFRFDVGGNLNVVNILKGSIDGFFEADFGVLMQMISGISGNTATPEQVQETLNQVIQAIGEGNLNKKVTVYTLFGTSDMKVKDLLWEMIDFGLEGKIGLYVPENLPLGGQELLGAAGWVKKSEAGASASARIKAGIEWKGKYYGLDKEIVGTIRYYFKEKRTDADLKLKSAKMAFAGMPEYDRRYTANDVEGRRLQFSSSSFIPMTKNSETRSGDGLLRSFSNEWSASKMQTMTDVSKGFSVAVRSKSNTTGLMLSCTFGSDELMAKYTAAEIGWKQSGNGEYYYGTVSLEIPTLDADLDGSSTGTVADLTDLTLAGDWTVQAYNADVTAIDAAGQIDCDFFYMVNPASISTFAYTPDATGNITWTNADLVDGTTYRMSFTLVNNTDTTITYPMGATPQWLGDNPATAFALSIDTLQTMSMLPTSNYHLRATLEKHDGVYTLVDDPTDDDLRHDLWLKQDEAKSTVFSHVNTLQPTSPITGLTGQMANGSRKYGWTLPADMTNVDGFHAYVQDRTTGEILATYDLPDYATELTVTAAAPPTGEATASNILFDTDYDLTIVPYHRFDNIVTNPDDPTKKDTLSTCFDGTDGAKVELLLRISTPWQPKIARVYRGTVADKTEKTLAGNYNSDIDGMNPQDIADFDFSLRSDHLLTLAVPLNERFTAATVRISEEMGLFAKNNPTGGTPTYTDITANATITPDDRVEIPFTGMTDGAYLLECKLNNVNDYSLYRFNLHIDNMPPMLVVGDKMQTEDGSWAVSGVTERDLAAFVFNGDTIDIPNGAFTLPVAADIPSLSISATDQAGNTATLDMQLGNIPQLPDGDLTAAIKIDSTFAQVKLNATTVTATAKVLRNGSYIDIPAPEASKLTWSVVKGDDVLDIDASSGLITPKAAGQAIIQATYAGILIDVTAISVAAEFPVRDLYVSDLLNADRTELHLSFTEPKDATGKMLEASTDTPVEGEVMTGWTGISATFDDAGHATLTVPDADKTCYFRLRVAGGLNEGLSNVAGKMGKMSSEVKIVYTVTFDSNGGTAIASQTIVEGGTATQPADPVRDGYSFEGWYNGTAPYDFNISVIRDLTLTAKWTNITGMEDIDKEEMLLYPNPANGIFHISGLKGGENIQVFNVSGHLLLTRKAASETESISVGHLAQGVYIVRITGGQTVKTAKLVKQ